MRRLAAILVLCFASMASAVEQQLGAQERSQTRMLADLLNKLAHLQERVERAADKFKDHEKRIRVVEQQHAEAE